MPLRTKQSAEMPSRRNMDAPSELSVRDGLDACLPLHLHNVPDGSVFHLLQFRECALAIVEFGSLLEQLSWTLQRSNVFGTEWGIKDWR